VKTQKKGRCNRKEESNWGGGGGGRGGKKKGCVEVSNDKNLFWGGAPKKPFTKHQSPGHQEREEKEVLVEITRKVHPGAFEKFPWKGNGGGKKFRQDSRVREGFGKVTKGRFRGKNCGGGGPQKQKGKKRPAPHFLRDPRKVKGGVERARRKGKKRGRPLGGKKSATKAALTKSA